MREKIFKLIFITLGLLSTFNMQGKDKNEVLTYDISCAGSGNQGFYLVQISAFVNKSSEINNDIVCKCAVHGVLFKGFTGSQGCTTQKPLAGSALVEVQNADFFASFFKSGGAYLSYSTIIGGSFQSQHIDKKYKVTAVVAVAKDQLRKDLEKAGIIKGLSSGF